MVEAVVGDDGVVMVVVVVSILRGCHRAVQTDL